MNAILIQYYFKKIIPRNMLESECIVEWPSLQSGVVVSLIVSLVIPIVIYGKLVI